MDTIDSREKIRAELKQANCVIAKTDNGIERVIHSREPIWHKGYIGRVAIVSDIEPRDDGKAGSRVVLSFYPRLATETPRTETINVIETPEALKALVFQNAEGTRAKEFEGRYVYIATNDYHDIGSDKDVRLEPISYTPTSFGGNVKVIHRDRKDAIVSIQTVQIEEPYASVSEKLRNVAPEFYMEDAMATDRRNNKIILHGAVASGDLIRTTFVGPCSDGEDGSEIYRVRTDARGQNPFGAYICVKEDVDEVKGILEAAGQAAQPMAPRRFVASPNAANALRIKPRPANHNCG